MYIKKVVLKNIRCFEEFVLEFDERERSVLIVGDNGEGKSTLLRSIAISLCDVSSAAALFRELRGKFVRQRSADEPSYIEIHLQDNHYTKKGYVVKTEIHPGGTGRRKTLERLSQTVWLENGRKECVEMKQEEFPWDRIFVAGYGAGSRALGTESIESYATIDAVYTLFRYDEPLQNPELALRRIKDEGSKNPSEDVLGEFLELLRNVLNLGKRDRVFLTKKGIEVRGPWGRSQLETLGDGYKSTIIWVLDLIGRRLLYGRTVDPKRMTGIVLLDEAEQHLHPRWQLNIMSLLHEAFPKIQFIVTTHSPLVVSGCKYCKIRKVTNKYDELSNAYGWRAEDVYRDILDLSSLRVSEIEEDIERYRKLDLRSLTTILSKSEENEMLQLKTKLNETLHGSDPVILSMQLKNLNHVLNNKGGVK